VRSASVCHLGLTGTRMSVLAIGIGRTPRARTNALEFCYPWNA